jgi:hypothetical protein
MGRARRRRMKRHKIDANDHSSILKETEDPADLPSLDIIEEVRTELADLGFPVEFGSTQGKHIDGQPNVEAARVGQTRRYQQFQGKKLKEWQIKRLRGVRLKQAREKLAKRR